MLVFIGLVSFNITAMTSRDGQDDRQCVSRD